MTDLQKKRAPTQDGLLVPGDTCWRVERADRLAVIVDAADYFLRLRAALRAARRAVYLIGWDLDLRLEMAPGESDAEGNAPDGLPNRLGDFLVHIVRATPDLSLHLLKWDKAMLVQLAVQARETAELKLASDRIHFAFDSHHPTAATHHQKIVVVDDRFAFCGGIDVTEGRWDTRAHAPDDPRRVDPGGAPTKPWHDVTTALDGPVAAALGELARMRWKAATGDALDPPAAGGDPDPWPDGLEVGLRDTHVAIARTAPDYRDQDEVREIERLYLAAIHAARRTVYLESQYFASDVLCRAIEDRLAEPDGPELVVVNPESAEGLGQHLVMDTARARMLERVRAAAERGGGGPDGRDRFRIYHPVNAGGDPIYVHAKVLVVDDRLVRIGSSNVNNRSMGFDTECDVAFEASTPQERAFALRLRDDLLAEHLGCAPEAVAEAAARGSLIGAIDALNGRAERRLCAIENRPSNAAEREMGERILSDERVHPRNRPHPLQSVTHGSKRAMAPYHVETVGIGTLLLMAGALGLGVWAGLRYARHRAERRAPRLATPAVHAPPRSAPAATVLVVPAAAPPEGDVS
jgi:phospholipase D1/2